MNINNAMQVIFTWWIMVAIETVRIGSSYFARICIRRSKAYIRETHEHKQ